VRTVREIAVPDRLWELLGRLAATLGTDRDALVVQALHAFLSFHGALPPPEAGEAAPAGSARAPEPPREAVTRRVLDTARDLERAITPGEDEAAAPATLWLHGERGPLARVDRDRFVIGRGRHCDLVIDSAKVSREHAVIRREVDGWWIEDLGSSNGTWYRQARVGRRRIADGDEYAICAERIRCVLS
jgi:pSer/pThr/pTyr-binding forkhead associated (FHA) protein